MELSINIFDRIIILLMISCVLQFATTLAVMIGFLTLRGDKR